MEKMVAQLESELTLRELTEGETSEGTIAALEAAGIKTVADFLARDPKSMMAEPWMTDEMLSEVTILGMDIELTHASMTDPMRLVAMMMMGI